MADSPSSPKSASPAAGTTAAAAAAKRPTLLPQAEHAGKPAMPLGAHQFTLIGSRNRAHLHLLSTTISRNHACIVLTKGGLYVRDLASRAGVILNGRKVKESDLHDGDLMQVGSFKFKFQDPAGSIRLPSTPRPPLAMMEMDGRSLTPLDERTVLIGRRPGCDITLDSPAVSNTHAVIFECDGKRYVRDLGSRTGTQVNGATVHQQALELGDQVTVGGTTFRYIAAEMPQLESSDAGLPLEAELQPATEPQQDFVPEGLEFEAPKPAPAQAPLPSSDAADDAIPLVDDEAAPAEAGAAEHRDAGHETQPHEIAPEHPVAEDQLRTDEDTPVAGEDATSDAATAEDLGLDFFGPEGEQAGTARPQDPRPAGIEFVNELATAGPIVEPITELSSMGFPLIEPEEAELPVAPTGLIEPREDETPTGPITTEPLSKGRVGEVQYSQPEPKPIPVGVGAEAVPAEPPEDEIPATVEPPSEAMLATDLPPAEAEIATSAAEITAESAEPITAEPEASPIELADETSAPNAGLEPTPEPITDEAPVAIVPSAELPEIAAAEPEAATLQVEQAEATAQAIEIEPDPLSEPLAETPTEPPAETVTASATDQVAPESEAEPVVSATESSGSESGLTIGEADAAQITEAGEAPSETPAAAELLPGAEEEQAAEPQAPAAPLRVEDVDLSAVKFEADTTEAEAAAEADESAAQPAPLLDLDAAPAAEAEVPAEPADEPQDAAAEKPKRKGRAKKKLGRGRRKKGDAATAGDLTAATEIAMDGAAESTAEPPVAEADGTQAAPVEGAADQASEIESATEPVGVATETEPEPVQPGAAAESQRREEHAEPTEAGAAVRPTETLGEEAHEVNSESEGAALAKPQAAETVATIEHDSIVGETGHDLVAIEQAPPELTQIASDIAAVEPAAGELTLTAPAEIEPPVAFTASTAGHDQGIVTEAPVETIDQTEPTLESALGLEPTLEEVQPPVAETPEATEPDAPAEAALSDTAFGEAVRDFASAELGPLVEEAPAAEAPREAVESEHAPIVSEPEPAAPAHRTAPGAATLSPLAGADLPPLELGPELTFGGDERPVAQEQAEAHEPALHEPAPDEALQLSDLDDAHETPALATPEGSDEPLELGGATEIQLDMRGEIGAESSAHPALEFGEAEGLDVELPPIDLGDEEHLELEGAAFAKPQAAEVPTPAVVSEPPIAEAPKVPDLRPSTEARQSQPEPVIAEAPRVEPEPAMTPPPAEPVAPASTAAPAQPAAAPPSPLDPFFGMGRDFGSFIGGMPLALGAATPLPATPSTAAPTPTVAAPATPPAPGMPAAAAPAVSKPATDPGADPDLDKLFEGEEPLELFDETADQLDKLPESLAPINDVSGALAEPKGGLAPAPGAPAGAAPSGPAPIPVAPAATVVTPVPLRTLTADPASVAPKPAPTNVAIPPFAGSRPPARPGMRAFSGMGGVKPTDVFSQTAFPPLDESAFKPQPITGAAPAAAASAPGHVPQPIGVGPLVPSGFKKADEPPRRPVERPAAAVHGAEPSRRRPWWKNLRVLLPLLIVLLAAAIIAIIWFFPPKTLVQGTLQIKGTDNSTADIWARHDQVTQVRDAIKDLDLRTEVLSNLQSRGIAPGFAQDPKSFALLADPSNSPFQDGRLVLKRPQVDPRDPQRMQAIVDVVYLRNRTQAEATPQVRGEVDDATKKVNDLQNRMASQQDQVKKLSDDLTVKAGAAAQSLLRNASAAVDSLQKEGLELQRALDQANAEVRLRHVAWQAASQNTVVDPKVLQIRQNLASLNAQLSVARVARSGRVDPAKAFDDQVQQVGEELTLIATATAGAKNSPLADYAATARGAATEVHSLLAQEKLDADQIAELRQQLAEHREAHLRQVWAADDTLKGLLEQREAQAHRYSAASDSGYTEEAARIQGVIEQLERQIEDRRQTLATTGQSSDETQQKLERTIQGLENERQQNGAKINQAMARLQVPTTGKISLGENAALLDLEKNVVAAQAQYDAYAAALAGKQSTAGDAEAEIHRLEGKIAEQQAQLDAYQQRSDAPAQVAAARQALDAAQEAQAKAQRALADNLDELMAARQYRDAQAKLKEYSDNFSKAQQDAQAMVARAAAVPVVLPPDPQTAVQVVRDEDQRVTYLVVAVGLIVALFAIPLWLAAREPEADVPYAHLMAEPREAFGQRGEDLQGDDVLPDEEHAALT